MGSLPVSGNYAPIDTVLAESVFPDGLKYIPLGSVTVEPPLPIKVEECLDEKEAFRVLSCIPTINPLLLDLIQFSGALWFRLARNFNTKLVTIQIYAQAELLTKETLAKKDVRESVWDRVKCRTIEMPVFTYLLEHQLDKDPRSFRGYYPSAGAIERLQAYTPVCPPRESLNHIFNTLSSPRPAPDELYSDTYGVGKFGALAMEALLDENHQMDGLRTKLFQYQRRSAATMIRRECKPLQQLDPRLEVMEGPGGHVFYFDRFAGVFKKDPVMYPEARGGILAETMGSGKTLICLAVIYATKHHMSTIPPQLNLAYPSTDGTRSLAMMAGGVIARNDIPWKAELRRCAEEGDVFESCEELMKRNFSTYGIVEEPRRSNQRSSSGLPKIKGVTLSSVTVVVLPENLMPQWEHEILTHFEEGAISYWVGRRRPMPPVHQLQKYDLVILERFFFENEMLIPEGYDARGAKTTYVSPLRAMRFLRIILDEGHDFVTTGRSYRTISALKELEVDRRWIVTGTPSSGLVGSELDMATHNSASQDDMVIDSEQANDADDTIISTSQQVDIKAIGCLMKQFLDVKPWSNSEESGDAADWSKYVMPDKDGAQRPASFRDILQGLIVRHTLKELQMEFDLPPLSVERVYLDPCFFDKLSSNLFLAVLATNAITSERTGKDYIFSQEQRGALDQLIGNLRKAGFFWNGFVHKSMRDSCKNAYDYWQRKKSQMSGADAGLLNQAMNSFDLALGSVAYKAFGASKEIGMVIGELPDCTKKSWSLCPAENQFVLNDATPPDFMWMSAARLVRAQAFVDTQASAAAPFLELARYGRKTQSSGKQQKPTKKGQQKAASGMMPRNPILGESLKSLARTANPTAIRNAKSAAQKFALPHRPRTKTLKPATSGNGEEGQAESSKTAAKRQKQTDNQDAPDKTQTQPAKTQPLKSALKRDASAVSERPYAYKDLKKPKLVGTASAKLSYLMDRIQELHREEKILIFYDAEHIAFYIAEALEILQVKHEIYAARNRADMHTRYLKQFHEDPAHRVMLMDLKLAAHGLNITVASRIFFVNPVWNPSVEAQAIKRAHRIGQTRPVVVEILVLRDAMEAAMLERRDAMTKAELFFAKKSPIHDQTMRGLIEKTPFAPFTAHEMSEPAAQYAPLKKPLQIFAQQFAGAEDGDDDDTDKDKGDEVGGAGASSATSPGPAKKRARFADADSE